MDNLICLNNSLLNKNYKHSGYHAFKINDPKPRDIHKASVSDRVIHHAVYRALYPFFDKKFIYDSYSCRLNKGVFKALDRFDEFIYQVSKNNHEDCWILQCDIKKFFASIDHKILKNILAKYISDKKALWLLGQIIDSFHTVGEKDKGLPLGNLTSQLLVNIYLNELDNFIKRKLKIKYYIRYADDFLILDKNKIFLEKIITDISYFLEGNLKLSLHPNKVSIKNINSGVDFLGWVNFYNYRVLRTSTRKRMIRRIKDDKNKLNLASYIGLLGHGNTKKLKNQIIYQNA